MECARTRGHHAQSCRPWRNRIVRQPRLRDPASRVASELALCDYPASEKNLFPDGNEFAATTARSPPSRTARVVERAWPTETHRRSPPPLRKRGKGAGGRGLPAAFAGTLSTPSRSSPLPSFTSPINVSEALPVPATRCYKNRQPARRAAPHKRKNVSNRNTFRRSSSGNGTCPCMGP